MVAFLVLPYFAQEVVVFCGLKVDLNHLGAPSGSLDAQEMDFVIDINLGIDQVVPTHIVGILCIQFIGLGDKFRVIE